MAAASVAARGDALVALSIRYGQRHSVESEHAAIVAAHLGAELLTVDLDLRAWGGSALTGDLRLPQRGTVTTDGIPATYVPARNTIFLGVALGVAEARDAESIVIGVNALDYSGYPDCRPEFVAAMQRVAELGTRRGVEGRAIRIETPLQTLTKAAIVRLGLELGAPLHLTWSCYAGGEAPCGLCESCVLRARGFAEAGVADPALPVGAPR